MTVISSRQALLPQGWASDVRIRIGNGQILSVETGSAAEPGDEHHDVLLPGMPNLHSHAFQHAMAGLAETRGPGSDSFWSWRDIMYHFALSMTPDDVEAVAAKLYADMLEAGFTRVGEFHYLHHQQDGTFYDDPAEMAVQIAAGAAESGIGLTLLPVFYAHSGFGGQQPADGQRRFVTGLDTFQRLHDACCMAVSALPGAVLGVAPHSLRAATEAQLQALLSAHGDGPVHIHVAEQLKEVEDCLAFCGQRPVQWLLDHMPVDERWCLIHATHMDERETEAVAKRGAVAGLCPITEANLGDGIFAAKPFREAGGAFGIGSDSNVQISVAGELRQLEYSQRLLHHARNVIAPPSGSTGATLLAEAVEGGAKALGVKGGICPGASADLVSLSLAQAPWHGARHAADAWIFAESLRPDCVWVRGVKQVEAGRHLRHDAIHRRFAMVMRGLIERCIG